MAAAPGTGSGNITIQVCGDSNTVRVCQRPCVDLWRPPHRKPRLEREVLLSRFESIPFTARQTELALIDNWLAAKDPISVLTFVGQGGVGKTRLAMETFRRYENGWSVGFITSFHEPSALAATPTQPSTTRAVLAVVDYAAAHTEDLRKFLEDLAKYGSHLPKVRIVLLERFADRQSGWYRRLFSYSQTAYTAGLFTQPEPIRLFPISETANRRAILEDTVTASAGFHQNTPRPSGQIEDCLLNRPHFGDPLVLMMAALAAWEKGLYGALVLSRPDLAVELARRERTRLGKRSNSKLLPHLAAHSTLCGGFDRKTLLKVAGNESDELGLQYGSGPGQLADDLAELLPGTAAGASGAIQPDIIGEAFVLDVKPDGIARAAHRNGGAVVRALTRALQDFLDPYKVRGENRSGIDGSQAVTWLRNLAADAQAGDTELLFAIIANLPDSSVELAPLAAELNGKLLSVLPWAKDLPEPLQAERALLLNDQGVRLATIGQREVALEAAREAVEIRRQLAAARPDAFLPDLAMSLNNCGTRLSAIGQREAALEAAREALEIRRQLAAARPDAFLPDLATSLNNYGIRLSAIGQREAALEAAREALGIYRQLAAARPDAFLPDLAMSLNNYGTMLSEIGQREAALEAAREAVGIYRQLTAARPDAFLPDLATSLNNYGNWLSEIGQREAALEAAREAVEIYRQLAAARPDAFLPGLATSLNNYGAMLSEIGQREAALETGREALGIYRQLAAARPDAFLPGLAASLHNYGNRLSEIGQWEAALEAAREAVEIRRQLAAARPDAFLPDLAMSLNNYGNRLSEIGQREAALEAAREAVEIYRQLAAARPDASLPDLAGSLNNCGAMLSEIGQREAALEAAREAVEIYRQLAAARPDAFLPDLAGSLNNYGNRLSAIRQREAALEAAREAVEIYRQLAAARPDAFLPDLARSLALLGTIMPDPGESRALFREALQKLSPHFLRIPKVYASLMGYVASNYLQNCQQSGSQPDVELLTNILPVFERLKSETSRENDHE